MRYVKLTVGVVLALAVLVFIVQNTETVQLDFLVWTLSMSRALMVFAVLVVGLVLGWLWSSEHQRRRQRRGKTG